MVKQDWNMLPVHSAYPASHRPSRNEATDDPVKVLGHQNNRLHQ